MAVTNERHHIANRKTKTKANQLTQVVQVGHALEQRSDELGGLHLREARSAHDALKQLATL